MRLWGFATFLGVFCLAATSAMASGCGFYLCWGAVSIGPQGEWAWSSGYAAEAGALARVQNDCPDCTQIATFYNSCGVIARGPDGVWGFGSGISPHLAQRIALRSCSGDDLRCEPAVWACSF